MENDQIAQITKQWTAHVDKRNSTFLCWRIYKNNRTQTGFSRWLADSEYISQDTELIRMLRLAFSEYGYYWSAVIYLNQKQGYKQGSLEWNRLPENEYLVKINYRGKILLNPKLVEDARELIHEQIGLLSEGFNIR